MLSSNRKYANYCWIVFCRLTIGKMLGEGAFGMVLKAEAVGIGHVTGTTTVAVKMLKGTTERVLF